jgi:hypothetical protein
VFASGSIMNMPAPDHQLSSWKEIASHLGVSVRTAQVWELERGLPVRRLPGGRLVASTEELVAWKAGSSRPESRRVRWPWIAVLAAVMLSAVAATYGVVVHGSSPVTWRFAENALVVSDAEGRALWRHVFDRPLEPDAYVPGLDSVWLGDLGDGRQSVLFAEYAVADGAPGILRCFDERGVERWHFVPGRTVRTAHDVFAPPYRFHRFVVGRLGRDHRVRVVVSSFQFPYFPNVVTLLSGDGTVLREYWHSGHLSRIALSDLDGTMKIYLGGASNARKQATLVVLDPDTIDGASTEPAAYQLLGFRPGREGARVFFPATCMTRSVDGYNVVRAINVHPDGLTVDVWERTTMPPAASIFYRLDRRLSLVQAQWSDAFVSTHARLYHNGELDHALTPAEAALLQTMTIARP